MARKQYKDYVVFNSLEQHIRKKHLSLVRELERPVTRAEIYNELKDKYGMSQHTLKLLKAGSYNPSILVALQLAEYFDTTVEELFWAERSEEQNE